MPKVFDPLTDKDRAELAELQNHWDQMQAHKQAYQDLLVKVSDRLSLTQISRFTGRSRQHLESQLKHIKR